MQTIQKIDSKWNFIRSEIHSRSNNNIEGRQLNFQLQILLTALSKTKNPRERQILISFYQKIEKRYKKLIKI